MTIAEAPEFDVLLVPGGYGQQELMNDEEVLSVIRKHFAAGSLLFSVCTGALLCGAAGVLRGRQATTHWAAWNLLPYYGAIPVRSRVVLDGNLVTAAGVTAGLDAALVVESLLGGDALAQEIQLSIQYAPIRCFTVARPILLRLKFCERSTKAIQQPRLPEKLRRGTSRRLWASHFDSDKDSRLERVDRAAPESRASGKSRIKPLCDYSRDQKALWVEKLAGATGLEPAASCVTGRRSNQLNYAPALKTNSL